MTLVKFEDIPIRECGEELVDLSEYDFALESVYFNQGLSPEPRMFLRKSVANKLFEIQKGLSGHKFKIWSFSEMDADHVAAWSKGGATSIKNCEMLCKTHNRVKGNR